MKTSVIITIITSHDVKCGSYIVYLVFYRIQQPIPNHISGIFFNRSICFWWINISGKSCFTWSKTSWKLGFAVSKLAVRSGEQDRFIFVAMFLFTYYGLARLLTISFDEVFIITELLIFTTSYYISITKFEQN